jgi:hypothetical protein
MKLSLARILCFCAIFFVSIPIIAQQQSLVGIWLYEEADGRAEMTLTAEGRYQFTLKNQQGKQSATGRYTIQGNTIMVVFDNGGMQQQMSFQFTGPDSINLDVGGTVLPLRRTGGGGQPANNAFQGMMGGPGNQGSANQQQPSEYSQRYQGQGGANQMGGNTPAGYTQHQHPQGFTFSAPANWTKTMDNNVMIMVPDDALQTPQGPAEAALVYAEQAPGITSVGDPQVQQYFNQQVAQVFPYLQSQGKKETRIGGVFYYAGRSPNNIDMVGQLYVKLSNNMALVSFGLSPRDRMQGRQQIFYMINESSSMAGGGQMQQMPQQQYQPRQQMPQQNTGGPGGRQGNPLPTTAPATTHSNMPSQGNASAADLDQRLIGLWTMNSETSYDGGYVAVTRGVLLENNGTYKLGSKSFVSGQTMTTDFSGDSDWEIEEQGQWSSRGNILTLRSLQGEMTSLRYEFTNNGIVFIDNSGERYECVRAQ